MFKPLQFFNPVVQITLNQEHKYMLSFAPDYDHLPLVAKVEVFEYALHNTEGNDLSKVCNVFRLFYAYGLGPLWHALISKFTMILS